MSNLSQFFGGGGPSNILRGSTFVQSSNAAAASVNTGVFVSATDTYMTQGCRGNVLVGEYRTATQDLGTISYAGSGSARINSSGEIVVTSGTGASRPTTFSPFLNGYVFDNSSTVDWEAVEF